MRRFIIALISLAFAFVPLCCGAQVTPTPPSGTETTLPPGVQFPGQLISKLHSHKSRIGDEVKLEVTANLRGPGGSLVLPQGAKLIGTVTAVADRNGPDGQSELAFVITRAEWHGGSMTLRAVPSALTAPKMRTQRDSSGQGGFGGDAGGGGGRGGSGGRGGGSDTAAMLSDAIRMEIKGVNVRQTGDPTATTVFFSQKDVSLPTGTVITLRQLKAVNQ